METTDIFRVDARSAEHTRDPMATPRSGRLVFVDHSYHAITGSSGFFKTMLDDAFDVVVLHCDGWRGGHRITARDVDSLGADVAVFWQALPSPIDLFRLSTPAIWVPMYDDVARRPAAFWRVLGEAGPHILSFCHALSSVAARYGLAFTEYRYFPDPSLLPLAERSDGRLRVLLWDRGDIGLDHLRRLVPPSAVEAVCLRIATDPDLRPTLPRASDEEAYRIRTISGPLPREEHLGLLAASDVFLAPRRLEGIGLSVLEAMAMGVAVVAPDRPAMNEYIHHAVTGYLYDPGRPRMLDLSDARAVGERARASIVAGYGAWIASEDAILRDIRAASPVVSHPAPRIAALARALAVVEAAKAALSPRTRSLVRRAIRSRRR